MAMPNPTGPVEDPKAFERRARELAELLKITPPGDHPLVAEHLANGVVAAIAGALSDIKMTVEVHHDMAPVAAHRVATFAREIANNAVDWIKGWAE